MLARFVQIKSTLLRQIEDGDLKPGERIPSENQLADLYKVSRMTARRALTELVQEGVLARSQGLGTFVSDHRPMSSMLEIKSINDEIQARGHEYSNELLQINKVQATSQQAAWLGVKTGETVFHTLIVHLENRLPVQLEDRLVNPVLAPEYLEQDFRQVTANQYLSKVAPLTQADHAIEAILPTHFIAEALNIDLSQPEFRH